MEEVFEPVTENQKQNQFQSQQQADKQIQALRESTQNTTGAIGRQTQGFAQALENQTRAKQETSQIFN